MERFDQRQWFLVSAALHFAILTLLADTRLGGRGPSVPEEPPREPAQRVFVPPPEALREALAMAPRPRPTPPPPAAKAKDRISIGAPSTERAKRLELRREDDLLAQPKGVAEGRTAEQQPQPVPTPASATRASVDDPGGRERSGLRLPPGVGRTPRGDEAPVPAGKGSIANSLRQLDERLAQAQPRGIPSGTGRQMGPLFFDPEGADFTPWINHFKNEVYRNWIMPQAVMLGFHGHCDFEFTVQRDGTMTGVRLLKSSGTPALDRAAQNALLGSRLHPLPQDFGPDSVTMQVSFLYNEEGQRES